MRTWDDYKKHVKVINEEECRNMEQIEELAHSVSSLIFRRKELEVDQRDLAKRCGISETLVDELKCIK